MSTDLGPFTPPSLRTPLYDCAGELTVTGAHPGSLLTVFSGAAANVLANPVVAASDVVTIPLWAPLVTGQSVQVAQAGCHADGQSEPERVLEVPSPVPLPVIAAPVLADATSVTVSDVLPGAQLMLFVNGLPAFQATAESTTWSIPVPAGALAAARFIEVTQELCGVVNARSDGAPGMAPVQKPALQPAGGLVGKSGYFFQNSCSNLTGVTVKIDVTEEIGGSGSSYNGFSFQLNCWSAGVTDVNAWQQFSIIVDPLRLSSPGILAKVNNWPYNWQPGNSDTINVNAPLGALATANLPAGYHFSIELTNDSNGNITSAIFGGWDNNGDAFTPQTIAIVGQPDQQGGTVTASQLAPIVAFQLLLVGNENGNFTTLTSGAGTWTISADDKFIATNTLPTQPTGNCWSFADNTVESSNCTYGELPAASSQAFTQTFSV